MPTIQTHGLVCQTCEVETYRQLFAVVTKHATCPCPSLRMVRSRRVFNADNINSFASQCAVPENDCEAIVFCAQKPTVFIVDVPHLSSHVVLAAQTGIHTVDMLIQRVADAVNRSEELTRVVTAEDIGLSTTSATAPDFEGLCFLSGKSDTVMLRATLRTGSDSSHSADIQANDTRDNTDAELYELLNTVTKSIDHVTAQMCSLTI